MWKTSLKLFFARDSKTSLKMYVLSGNFFVIVKMQGNVHTGKQHYQWSINALGMDDLTWQFNGPYYCCIVSANIS